MAEEQLAFSHEAAAVAAVDLDKIEARLRETSALGTWTKMRLGAAFGSIVEDIERYYGGEPTVDLPTLRQRYDMLVHEAAVQLRGGDPGLAGTLLSARDAIWQALIRR